MLCIVVHEGGGGTCPLCPLPESAYDYSLQYILNGGVGGGSTPYGAEELLRMRNLLEPH